MGWLWKIAAFVTKAQISVCDLLRPLKAFNPLKQVDWIQFISLCYIINSFASRILITNVNFFLNIRTIKETNIYISISDVINIKYSLISLGRILVCLSVYAILNRFLWTLRTIESVYFRIMVYKYFNLLSADDYQVL